jgi:hypothetical protein
MRGDDDPDGVEGPRTPIRHVSKRWTIAAATVAALVVGATSLAASTAPPTEARALGELFFNKNMARAEVVMFNRGAAHDYRIDQGKLLSVHQGTVELLERDGTHQLIPIAPTAQVLLNGRPTSLASLPLRLNIVTIRDGDQPAQTVRVTGLVPRKP